MEVIEQIGEFIRNATTVFLIDNDALEIYFEKTAYSVGEDEMLAPLIRMSHPGTQSPFILLLRSMSIE
jgi:hypothetical protein